MTTHRQRREVSGDAKPPFPAMLGDRGHSTRRTVRLVVLPAAASMICSDLRSGANLSRSFSSALLHEWAVPWRCSCPTLSRSPVILAAISARSSSRPYCSDPKPPWSTRIGRFSRIGWPVACPSSCSVLRACRPAASRTGPCEKEASPRLFLYDRHDRQPIPLVDLAVVAGPHRSLYRARYQGCVGAWRRLARRRADSTVRPTTFGEGLPARRDAIPIVRLHERGLRDLEAGRIEHLECHSHLDDELVLLVQGLVLVLHEHH